MRNSCPSLVIPVLLLNFGCVLYADSSNEPYNFKDFPSPNSGTSNASSTSAPSASTSPSTPTFRTSVDIRKDSTGLNVGVYGGAIAFQDGTLHITSGAVPGAEINGSTQSRIGGVAGIRVGYTWRGFKNSDALSPDSEMVLPALDEELFWTGYNYKATDATFGTGSNLTADVNTLSFMVDPKLKFRLGAFRPYFGFGVGGTYVNVGNAKINVPGLGTGDLTGSSDDVDFSVQGLAGLEIFVSQHWALTLDYKYQYIVDPTFHGNIDGADVKYHLDGLGGHLFTGGISYYF